jgi:hypothetical protein
MSALSVRRLGGIDMDRPRTGQYLAGLAIIGAVFALFFFFVMADRSAPNGAGGALTEQVQP